MTEKSMTDHGPSGVAQKDCAVWRGVTAGELCREWQDGSGILMVDNQPQTFPVQLQALSRAHAQTF